MPLFIKRNKASKKQQQQRRTSRKASSLDFLSKGKEKKEETHTIGGGFRSTLKHQGGARVVRDHDYERDGNCSTAPCSERSSSTDLDTSWASAGSNNFHKHSPLFVKPLRAGSSDSSDNTKKTGPPRTVPPMPTVGRLTREGSDGTRKVKKEDLVDDMTQLGLLMKKDRQLPGTWYYSSNHILVNKERIKRNAIALTRRVELDALATERAQKMAQDEAVQHGVPEDIQFRLHPVRRFGENVASGASIRDIHKDMIQNAADLNNMVDRRYTHMGMGTAKSEDGTLYLCQIFKG
mmetsp:Transcript_29636/g.48905  ORF Transcript_29636/g.48905 Transcript_29636/m.48905 type:complete len:292 (-) Transcript_29636:71-946(-)|eukprot:CAMPEP_0119015806 /NCGR_PEP_ID=MMETSP1176-20130426/11662_1 /TAXON_ID=265551 /ORGANISM="Synedropsis recta cf, Strain CCMP1620" /LENGTH=291 /DNA_ID=CAMNT_0006969127 /DNA_START=86 /DNA_END=961 /DNA_ORIENTATION=+